MNIYNISSERSAIQIKQLIQLSSECIRLQWSRTIKDIPDDVIKSLDRIENFVNERVSELCENAQYNYEMSSEDEDSLMQLLKENPNLNEVIGSGVIMNGDQSDEMKVVLEQEKHVPQGLLTSLQFNGSTIIF